MFAMYAFLHAVRFVMIALVFPLFRFGVYPVNIKEGVMLLISGQRGAISLLLALECKLYYNDRHTVTLFHS